MRQDVYLIKKLFENKKKELMRSPEAWAEYLETAGKHYKYDFVDAALIEAQDRGAAALATAEFWENPRMGRKLRKDANSIAVIRTKDKASEAEMCVMNIVIFEHDSVFQQYLESFVRQYTHHPSALSTGLLREVGRYIGQDKPPTLFFLDIVFENEEDRTYGFTAAKMIRERRPDDLLVFVTGYPRRIEGNTFFQVAAFNTIYKPPADALPKINGQLAATIDLARDFFDRECLILTGREQDVYIPMRTICYIEVLKGEKRLIVHTTQGQYMMRGWLKTVKKKLDGRFVYVSRFAIANKDAVREKDKINKRLIFSDGSSCRYSDFCNKRYGHD